jgi:hypothetical protein
MILLANSGMAGFPITLAVENCKSKPALGARAVYFFAPVDPRYNQRGYAIELPGAEVTLVYGKWLSCRKGITRKAKFC